MLGDVAVIGGGLQGSLAALELATLGVPVTLFERDDVVMGRASRWNEGKVHLGYIYANDPSLDTARLMARGAVTFGSLLGRHIDPQQLRAGLSEPFRYAVLRDSLLAPEVLAARYARMDGLLADASAGRGYLGAPLAPVRRVDPGPLGYADAVQAVFETSERSVDVHAVADAVAAALVASSGIEVVVGHVVEAITRGGDGRLRLLVDDEVAGPFAHVVNAAWDGRLALDATAGVRPGRPHLFRFKYAVHLADVPGDAFPTTSFVLGPYGDIVRFGSGAAYLSWYPEGCTGRSSAATIPADWGRVDDTEALTRRIVAGCDALHPGVGAAVAAATGSPTVDGGVIFTWGDTDIDDPDSELHQRHDVGVSTHGGDHHTVDTGKYTLAPLFAQEVAQRVVGERAWPLSIAVP